MTLVRPQAVVNHDDLREQRQALINERAKLRPQRDEAEKRFSQDPTRDNSAEFVRLKQTVQRLDDDITDLEEQISHGLRGFSGNGAVEDGESFLNDPGRVRELAQMTTSSQPWGRVNLGVGVSQHQLLAMLGQAYVPRIGSAAGFAELDPAGGARRDDFYGIVPQLRRRPLRLLDLFQSFPMSGRSFEYAKETGVWDTGVAETPEGSVKPEDTVDFPEDEAVAKTIASFVRVKKQQLADFDQLRQIIQDRLTYKVLRRFENQILSGDGLGENIKGILNTTGILSVVFTAGAYEGDQILEGIGSVLAVDATPDFVALNPSDYIQMLKAKAAGDGQYYSGGPWAVAAAAERIWNTTAVPSTAIAANTSLVGDSNGAKLFVREGVNVLASDSDSDNFIKNLVTVLGEMRGTVAVFEPACFCKVALA